MIVLNRTDDGDLNPQLILRLAQRAVAVPTLPQDDVHIQTAIAVAWRNASRPSFWEGVSSMTPVSTLLEAPEDKRHAPEVPGAKSNGGEIGRHLRPCV